MSGSSRTVSRIITVREADREKTNLTTVSGIVSSVLQKADEIAERGFFGRQRLFEKSSAFMALLQKSNAISIPRFPFKFSTPVQVALGKPDGCETEDGVILFTSSRVSKSTFLVSILRPDDLSLNNPSIASLVEDTTLEPDDLIDERNTEVQIALASVTKRFSTKYFDTVPVSIPAEPSWRLFEGVSFNGTIVFQPGTVGTTTEMLRRLNEISPPIWDKLKWMHEVMSHSVQSSDKSEADAMKFLSKLVPRFRDKTESNFTLNVLNGSTLLSGQPIDIRVKTNYGGNTVVVFSSRPVVRAQNGTVARKVSLDTAGDEPRCYYVCAASMIGDNLYVTRHITVHAGVNDFVGFQGNREKNSLVLKKNLDPVLSKDVSFQVAVREQCSDINRSNLWFGVTRAGLDDTKCLGPYLRDRYLEPAVDQIDGILHVLRRDLKISPEMDSLLEQFFVGRVYQRNDEILEVKEPLDISICKVRIYAAYGGLTGVVSDAFRVNDQSGELSALLPSRYQALFTYPYINVLGTGKSFVYEARNADLERFFTGRLRFNSFAPGNRIGTIIPAVVLADKNASGSYILTINGEKFDVTYMCYQLIETSCGRHCVTRISDYLLICGVIQDQPRIRILPVRWSTSFIPNTRSNGIRTRVPFNTSMAPHNLPLFDAFETE